MTASQLEMRRVCCSYHMFGLQDCLHLADLLEFVASSKEIDSDFCNKVSVLLGFMKEQLRQRQSV